MPIISCARILRNFVVRPLADHLVPPTSIFLVDSKYSRTSDVTVTIVCEIVSPNWLLTFSFSTFNPSSTHVMGFVLSLYGPSIRNGCDAASPTGLFDFFPVLISCRGRPTLHVFRAATRTHRRHCRSRFVVRGKTINSTGSSAMSLPSAMLMLMRLFPWIRMNVIIMLSNNRWPFTQIFVWTGSRYELFSLIDFNAGDGNNKSCVRGPHCAGYLIELV